MAKKPDDIFGEDDVTLGGKEAVVDATTQTPAFQAALQAEVAKMKAELLAALAPASGAMNATELLQGLALSIAEMTHQGDKRQRPLDPKIVAEREAAQTKLDALILDVRRKAYEVKTSAHVSEAARYAAVKAVSPKYAIVSKTLLDDQIIEPFHKDEVTKRAVVNERYWLGEPNDAMKPLNPLAEQIFALFRASRGNRTKAEKYAIKPAWMTDKGLIVEGGNVPGRRGIEQQVSAARDNDDLLVPDYLNPDAEFVQVLGTLSDPAQQNFQGKRP